MAVSNLAGNLQQDPELLSEVDAQAAPVRRVLVVDDSRMQRRILSAQLARSGYEVTEASSAEEAIEICKRFQPDIVLSDWMMEGMTGLDFCRAFRAMERDGYGYFVLLTSKTAKEEVAEGLHCGADDFLAKPVNGDELRARLAAGERILRMERELTKKNQLLSSTLDELKGLYDGIRRDLREARKLQQSLVKERQRSFGSSEVTLMLRPSGHVGGDLVGFFPINARRVGLYGIDVSGHGITSALMTARLAGYLSGSSPDQNIALIQSEFGIYEGMAPHALAEYLNTLVLEEVQTESYFTLIYADLDLVSGEVELVQAGHPHPCVLRANGDVEFLGDGGLPVGLIEGATYELISTKLQAGDRLILMSDGITEAAPQGGELLMENGLETVVQQSSDLRGQAYLDALFWDVENYANGALTDDVSAVLFEFNGAKKNAD
ncbi:fused response regulator/phosphatase [Thioclava sp. SK-1]|uniref:PP2C family protein-serine/threonine phosphatase n=1 Tax=Thioclava sp. SK-1 TaxID=1889770 RepID=UPI000825610D|nr:response regulator [Thioclava sp. SK-1]OCX61695.1 fused response regulator/phosphatase [Thioclava sp. SK-1]